MVLVPDPSARRPGRGAWLHLAPGCLDLAERRRAFARALRVQGAVDAAAVRGHVERTVEHEAVGDARARHHQAVPPEHQPSSSEAGQQLMGTR